MAAKEKDLSRTLISGGRERKVHVHLPAGGGKSRQRPVLLALHGRLGTGRLFRGQSGLNEIADREGFIVLYPDGLWRSWADGRGLTRADREGVEDVVFLEETLNWAGRELDADLGRILVAGHSNGGFMALRLGLEKPGRISGVTLVAGTLTPELAACVSVQSPVSALFAHGSHDTVIPAQGGRQPGGVRPPPLEEAFGIWAQRIGCPAEEESEERVNSCGLPVLRRTRSDCARAPASACCGCKAEDTSGRRSGEGRAL